MIGGFKEGGDRTKIYKIKKVEDLRYIPVYVRSIEIESRLLYDFISLFTLSISRAQEAKLKAQGAEFPIEEYDAVTSMGKNPSQGWLGSTKQAVTNYFVGAHGSRRKEMDVRPVDLSRITHIVLNFPDTTSKQDTSKLLKQAVFCLENMPHLNALQIRGKNIDNISALVSLAPKLRYLSFANTSVSNAHFLEHFKKLKTLDMGCTYVQDLSFSSGLKNLGLLIISGNDHHSFDLAPLKKIAGLKYVEIAMTPLKDDENDAIKDAIEAVEHVDGIFICKSHLFYRPMKDELKEKVFDDPERWNRLKRQKSFLPPQSGSPQLYCPSLSNRSRPRHNEAGVAGGVHLMR